MDAGTPTFGTKSERYRGRVKWFNSRAGYGFITVTTDDTNTEGEDLFVHHTAINVGSEQYKYLVEGEYISFTKIESESNDHKFQAGEVTGLDGGQLMCETRNVSRSLRAEKSKEGDGGVERGGQRTRGGGGGGKPGGYQRRGDDTRERVLVRGSGPREEWYLVKRRRGPQEDRSRNTRTRDESTTTSREVEE